MHCVSADLCYDDYLNHRQCRKVFEPVLTREQYNDTRNTLNNHIEEHVLTQRKEAPAINFPKSAKKPADVEWAEGLNLQLPADHEGRNSWLLNYGVSMEADTIRSNHVDTKGGAHN